MSNWQVFTGKSKSRPKRAAFPEPPPWRRPGKNREDVLAKTFQPVPGLIDAVNAAIYLRRPLLVTGKPGTGKSSLIYAVTRELALGDVLAWPINSRSSLREGLYQYDALARLQHVQSLQARGLTKTAAQKKTGSDAEELRLFLTLEPLGTALASTVGPRALLIDEIDKSDVDLPNDLLNVLDTGRFVIPEVRRAGVTTIEILSCEKKPVVIRNGEVTFSDFPFVVMTSNGERDFPAPFLRRCVQFQLPEPGEEELKRIVAAHFPKVTKKAERLIGKFIAQRGSVALATDQLLNAVHMIYGSGERFTAADEDELLKTLFQGLG